VCHSKAHSFAKHTLRKCEIDYSPLSVIRLLGCWILWLLDSLDVWDLHHISFLFGKWWLKTLNLGKKSFQPTCLE